MSELQRAELLADRILMAVGHREQAPPTVVEAADIRQRAFTLFLGAYEYAQRAVRYLRSEEEDWDDIAPSIYSASRSNARKKDDGKDVPVPPLPAASPPAAGASGPAPLIQNGSHSVPSSKVGLPDSDPFVRG